MLRFLDNMIEYVRRLITPPKPYEVLLTRMLATRIVKHGHWVAMFYLEIEDYKLIEQIYGSTYCNQILQNLNWLIRSYVPEYLKPYKFIESFNLADDIIIFFYSPGQSPPEAQEMVGLASQCCKNLSVRLDERCGYIIPAPINLQFGYSLLYPVSEGIEKMFYEGLKEAMLTARNHLDAEEIEKRRHFGLILQKKDVTIVYQPLVSLVDGNVMGYEALLRGPQNTFFHNPVNLFNYAEKTNQLLVLEKFAIKKSLSVHSDTLEEKKLFININPQTIHSLSFCTDEIIPLLVELGVTPQQVVFEITERTGINDFRSFRESVDYYRQNGFQIAVDDAGSGYSSLQAISELQPDFIKLDISLIRDIDKTPYKRSMVETFLTFSEKTGSRIVAEGIETGDELDCLRELGVSLGQGFFLARPDNPFPNLDYQAYEKITMSSIVTNHRDHLGRMIPVGSISHSIATITVSTRTEEVVDFFIRYPHVEGLAILEEQRPVGLVMRDKLFNQLATQFGFAIYNERPVSLVMDNQPMIVEDDTPVEQVSQTALNRPDNKVYDSIIVTKNKIYMGLVSLRTILDIITKMQVEAARFANPLTGLPGNRQIEEELFNRLNSGEAFSIIYSDLDNFKSVNDCYGFERGDLVIKSTAEIIKDVSARVGKSDDMVGHIGGDDYIIITRPEAAKEICNEIVVAFDRSIPEIYDPEDRIKGYIDTRDRQERPVRLPLMSISLALIDAMPKQYQSIEQLSRLAAELKKYAKSKKGSVYVKDCEVKR